MYVNELASGDTDLAEVENLKQKSIELFSKGFFNKNDTRILHRLRIRIQIMKKHTPNNYSVVILVIQKS